MLYSILIYGSEDSVAFWIPQQKQEVMGRHTDLRQDLEAEQRLGPVFRLAPNASSPMVRSPRPKSS